MQLQDTSPNSKPYPVPANEEERNEALRSYRVMDSPPEIAFNEIGELAAVSERSCDCHSLICALAFTRAP